MAKAVEIVGGLVRIYAPTDPACPTDWRLSWRDRFNQLHDTSAVSLEAARIRASELVLELTTDVSARVSAQFASVVTAYVADADWNPNHGNQQLSLLRTWIVPWLGQLATNQIRVSHTEEMLRAAAAVGRKRATLLHIRRAAVNVMRWAHAHEVVVPQSRTDPLLSLGDIEPGELAGELDGAVVDGFARASVRAQARTRTASGPTAAAWSVHVGTEGASSAKAEVSSWMRPTVSSTPIPSRFAPSRRRCRCSSERRPTASPAPPTNGTAGHGATVIARLPSLNTPPPSSTTIHAAASSSFPSRPASPPDTTEQSFWDVQGPLADRVFRSEDAKEGARAFAEKRPSAWTAS